jgi:predicted amidophosphoribosyltransferase
MEGVAEVSLQMAKQALMAERWTEAVGFAERGAAADANGAGELIAVASLRLARRAALEGDFAGAVKLAETACTADPRSDAARRRLALLRKAAGRVSRVAGSGHFPDTIGMTSGQWWKGDLLRAVRGWDDQGASVPAPTIMAEVIREHLEDIYALGIYRPWHDGIPPKFTQYVRELKKQGATVEQAAILLYQGLTRDVQSSAPGWIEQIDAIVPMATGWRSYEERGREITEDLADGLAAMLCVPCVDIFERSADATPTHQLSGYEVRVEAIVSELRLKNTGGELLRDASGVLIVDDVVTYGSTFEACARKIREVYPQMHCWGAALAYTQTASRLEKVERETNERG